VLTAEQPVNLPGLKDPSLGQELTKYVALVAAKPSPPLSASAARQALEPQDKAAEWKVVWTYDGLLRPTRVRGVRRVTEDVVDLGKVVDLAEIRAVLTGPMWQPTSLPEDIRVAVPPLESAAWRKLSEKPEWRPTVHTGNYGRADPVAEGFQVIRPKGVKARYVQAKGAENLIYCDAAGQTAGRPLRLEIADADRDGSPEVLVAPHIWPPFLRKIQEQDDTLALLRADGREARQFTARTNFQAVRLLDTEGDGRRQVVALTNDARIHVLPPDGRAGRELDLYAMHQRFNATEGRPNTRQPAGGFTMPYALGLWRRDAQGRAKMVVARYGALSFLDARGQFEGVLIAGGYVMPGLLPHGVDVDGDGVDEQICLSRGQVFQIRGDATPTVRDPGGTNFFPQVYSAKALKEPDWDERVDGAPVLLFEMLPWGGSPRYALIVRENYLGLYDAREHRWAFTWTPLVPLASAAIAASTRDTLRVRAVATDDLLWELDWEGRLDKLSRFATCPLPDRIRRITASPHAPGHTLLAGQQGLYLMRERDDVAKIAQGPFQDAGFLRVAGENALAIVAIRDDGRVVRLIRQ